MKLAQFHVSLDLEGTGIISMSCPHCGKMTVRQFDGMTPDTKMLCGCGASFGIGKAGYQTARRNIERYLRVIEGIAHGPRPA